MILLAPSMSFGRNILQLIALLDSSRPAARFGCLVESLSCIPLLLRLMVPVAAANLENSSHLLIKVARTLRSSVVFVGTACAPPPYPPIHDLPDNPFLPNPFKNV